MFRFAIVLFILGVVVGFMGIKETRLWMNSSATPTKITLDEIARSGPPDNRYIQITDFLLVPEFVYTQGRFDKSKYSAVYIPVVSPKSPYGVEVEKYIRASISGKKHNEKLPEYSGQFPVLLKSTKLENDEAIGELNGEEELEGLVVNSVESLGEKESSFLRKSFPGVDLSKVVVLDHGRKPSGFFMLVVYYGGALLLMAGGALVGLSTLKKAGQAG